MGGKGDSGGGSQGVTYKGTHLQGTGAAGKGDFGSIRGPSRQNNMAQGESRGYEGGELTDAAKQSLAESMKSAVRGFGTGGVPGAMFGFVSKEARNAEDVDLSNRMGVDLDTTRNIANPKKTRGLLGTENDDDDNDGFGSEEGSAGGAGNSGMGRGGSEGTWA